MAALVLLIGFALLTIGLVALAAPSSLRSLIRRVMQYRWLYWASGFRVLIGGILVLAASSTRMPGFITGLGAFFVLAGILGPILGEERTNQMANWWSGQSNLVVSVWGAVVSALGAVVMLASLN